MNNLTFQYPTWFLLFCVALGVSYALVLYFRDRRFQEQSKVLNSILGVLRGTLVTLLAVLLLSPLLKSILTQTQKPIIVIAQDVSESAKAAFSASDLQQYQSQLLDLSTALAENFEVKTYSFGSQVREGIDTAFNDKVSNISELLSYTYDLYSNQNLGAVILATDGIYNEGSNPIYSNAKLNTTIYTVALGDTIPKKDLILKRVFHNKIAYLNDRFAIQIDIAAQNSAGKNTNLVVSKIENGNAKTLQSLPININQDDFFTTREVILEATQAGVQRYRVSLTGISEEASLGNNTKDFFIDVLDARQKILLLANSPHPDLAALKQTLTNNKNYEVTTAYITNFQGQVNTYDFVILHQLPSKTQAASNVRATLNAQKIPHFFILGTQSNLNLFNQYQSLLTIRGDGRNTDDVQPIVQPDFSLFTLEETILQTVRQFPPLLVPFGDYQANPESNVLLRQRVGRIDTPRPLLILGTSNDTKVGVLAGEGLWKWRLFDYLQHNNHDIFDALIGKTMQYIALKEDKRRLRINTDQNITNENEAVGFGAELYNASYERINTPDVNLVITDESNRNYTFLFDKTENAYRLNAGILPVGNYTFKGTSNLNGEILTAEGQFSVQPIQLEQYETTANHGLLRILSESYGGLMLYPNQINTLPEQLKAQGNVKPVLYQTTQTRPIIELKWIFFLLLALLTLEWFLRRYFGAY